MRSAKPMSIKIISWYLILCGIISIVTLPLVYNVPYLYKVAAALTSKVDSYTEVSFITGASMLVSGVLIYKRNRAGVNIYAFITPIALVTMTFIYNTKPIVLSGVIAYFIIMYFLFNRTGKSYFNNEYIENQVDEDGLIESDGVQTKKTSIARRIAGCILFLIGDYLFCTYMVVLFPMIFSMGEGVTVLAVSSIFVMIFLLSLMFIVIGMFIWGRSGWKDLMVIGPLIIGIMMVMGGVGIMIAADMPQLQAAGTRTMELLMERGMLIAGGIHIAIAAAFSKKFKNKVKSLLMNKGKVSK